MIRSLLSWLLGSLLYLGLSLPLAASELRALADRTELKVGETLLLTLELNDPAYFIEPDIQPLKQDFELLGSSHDPLLEHADGNISRWQFRLRPKRSGKLEIPAIRLGKLSSLPLELRVHAWEQLPPARPEPLYIEASLDEESPYLQAQSILTLRVHHSLPLYGDGLFSPLEIPNARVEPLGTPRTYEQFIHGIRHGIIEVRYALFPQVSGTLNIPPLRFSATLVQDDPGELDSPGDQRPGQHLSVSSPAMHLNVRAIPDEWPRQAPWLPARQLQLEEHWQPNANKVRLDQPLTRQLTLRADGLPASFLPSLLPDEEPGFHVYANPPELLQDDNEQGITGQRSETRLLVGQQAGSLATASVDLLWWNTRHQRIEQLQLPRHSVQLQGAAPTGDTLSATPFHRDTLPWQITCLLLLIGNLLFILLWLKARRQPAISSGAAARTGSAHALEQLRKACLANQPGPSRTALEHWARQKHSAGLPELCNLSPELEQALRHLNEVLYAPGNQQWQGQALWNAVASLSKASDNTGEQQLPPLYPV